jgi:hypothetical protein
MVRFLMPYFVSSFLIFVIMVRGGSGPGHSRLLRGPAGKHFLGFLCRSSIADKGPAPLQNPDYDE